MLDENAAELVTLAISRFSRLAERPTSEEIRHRIERLNLAYDLPPAVLEDVIAEIETSILTSMPAGTAVIGKGSRQKWLAQKRHEIDFKFWNRYVKYLQYDRSFPPGVIKTLDSTLDDLLELLGDPKDQAPFLRRGLIVGDVQSGKTATYIGLCSKAADAGYEIIILLAGHMNSLRYQTQERLDEGFAGRDSKLLGKLSSESGNSFGVAKYDRELFVHEYTTKLHDFDTSAAQSIGSPLAGLRGPALLVIKKNKTILDNLYKWLKSLNPVKDGKIRSSLLLIDDEADFASVNTGKEYDPKAVNKGIRQLLELFDKASYAGVTATPYANVFISPEKSADMFFEQLFPDDYIYSLEPPSNYVGPNQVFNDDLEQTVIDFDDIEPFIPLKHDKNTVVSSLPNSLIRAIYAFQITNAVRDLRHEGPTNRTMLVNVSPFNGVQRQVSDLIIDQLAELRTELSVFGGLSSEDAITQSVRISELKDVFDAEYAAPCLTDGLAWNDILSRLHESNKTITVMTVNMSSRSQLNYDQYKDVGLRVIAVGGHSLSRGLTLEGLCISYFHRNSKAYDTLLQMGRWFGYRPGYRDLCRVFMTEIAIANYQFITDATQELKNEFAYMRETGATPADFGLKVRASQAGLMITAAAKMKTAKKVMYGNTSLSIQQLEATQLSKNKDVLDSNEDAVSLLLNRIKDDTSDYKTPQSIRLWTKQPKQVVIDFLEQYRVHTTYVAFRPGEVAAYLKATTLPELAEWDICIRGGDQPAVNMYGIQVQPSGRRLVEDPQESSRFTVGERSSRKLASGNDNLIGLNDVAIEALKNQSTTSGVDTGVRARIQRNRPLLILYYVKATARGEKATYIPPTNPFTAISLNFPAFYDQSLPEQKIYMANQIWQKYEDELRADVDEDDERMNEEQ